jgi:hypothetical protein
MDLLLPYKLPKKSNKVKQACAIHEKLSGYEGKHPAALSELESRLRRTIKSTFELAFIPERC